MFFRSKSCFVLALAISSVGGLACDSGTKPSASDAKGADSKAAEAKADAKAGDSKAADDKAAGAKEGASEECASYASKLCEKTGKESSACVGLTDLSPILPPAACKAGVEHLDDTLKRIESQRSVCNTLVEKLCKELGEETETCKMVKEQTAKFPPDRCKSMTDQYDSVLSELKAMEARNKPLDEALAKEIAAGDVPAFGPEDAKVTVVEFSDFQCPYCSRAADVVTQVKEKYSDKVRFVFRQFPLSFHKEAHLASQAALAAEEQGKFWEYHDLLFKNQGALQREDLEKYAKEVGLDMDKFKKALDDKTYAQQVDSDIELGKKVFVSGTPTLFINGERVANATDFAAVSKDIDEALAKG